MTCIVGLVHEGSVYIGADSAAIDTNTLDVTIRSDEKVFFNDEMLIGFAGSFRMGQLLRYGLTVPEHSAKKDTMTYLVTDFIDAVRVLFHEKGLLLKEGEVGMDGTFMVAYRGELFVIDEDFQVARPRDAYAALGTGLGYALGSLHAMRAEPTGAETKIRRALDAATYFSAGVREPYVVLRLTESEEQS